MVQNHLKAIWSGRGPYPMYSGLLGTLKVIGINKLQLSTGDLSPYMTYVYEHNYIPAVLALAVKHNCNPEHSCLTSKNNIKIKKFKIIKYFYDHSYKYLVFYFGATNTFSYWQLVSLVISKIENGTILVSYSCKITSK